MISENPLSAALLRMLKPAGRLACLITFPLPPGVFLNVTWLRGDRLAQNH